MYNMKQSLPGIVRIAYLRCENVPSNIELKSLVGIPAVIYDTTTEVAFSGTPTCVIENEYDNHSQVEKTKLTFSSTDEIPIRQQLAFLILDTNGQWWLIGHREDPFPVIKCTHQTGEPDGEKAGNVYEVTLIGRKSLISVSL